MENSQNFSKIPIETNSDMWEINDEGNEPILQLINNKVIDHVGGKVTLFKELEHNYKMQVEMRFLGHHLAEGNGGWFGLAIRAKDTENYELVWFMPNAEEENTVAYVSVAHGVVPWWTEAYRSQQKGKTAIPKDEWFQVQVEVIDDEFTVYVEGAEVLNKKLTYYLTDGYPGLYVGTATDAAFRRIEIERL
ncbi:family 16 glycoside hydrolase [Thermodesulfobacteriota bacterium]